MRRPAFLWEALLVAGCLGAGEHTATRRTLPAGERVETPDAGPPCWDSGNFLICSGNTFRQCAPAPGEGCVRCTCAIGAPVPSSGGGCAHETWTDRGNQNLMGQPHIP